MGALQGLLSRINPVIFKKPGKYDPKTRKLSALISTSAVGFFFFLLFHFPVLPLAYLYSRICVPPSQFHRLLPNLILFSSFSEVLFEPAKIYGQPDLKEGLRSSISRQNNLTRSSHVLGS
jgi:hypothetical protein